MKLNTGARQTGRTTKMVVGAVNAMLHGKNVLIVCQNFAVVQHVQQKLASVLEAATGVKSPRGGDIKFTPSGGAVLVVSISDLHRVKGRLFHLVYSDPGELEEHEREVISVHPLADVTYFQTEYEADYAAPESVPNSRRVLSSR